MQTIDSECEHYLQARLDALHAQLKLVDELAAANDLPDAILTDADLKITPLDESVPQEAQNLIDKVAASLPHVKITELLLEVDQWTGFTKHFAFFLYEEQWMAGYAVTINSINIEYPEERLVTKVRAIASKVVSSVLQENFAELSGDRNPMHTDPVAARRTQAGQQVVHGVHTLLWALDALVASGHIVSPLVRIKAKFLKWVYLGDESVLTVPIADSDPGGLKVEVLGMPILTADLVYGKLRSSVPPATLVPSPAQPIQAALELTFADLNDYTGEAFTATAEDSRMAFPHLAVAIGATAIAEIAACSYIVGMEAPGLYSILSRLDLTMAESSHSEDPRTALHYAVVRHDERFRRVQIAVSGRAIGGCTGCLSPRSSSRASIHGGSRRAGKTC